MTVFINCPLDARYVPVLRAITFVLLRYRFEPRIAIEDADTNRNRLQKITDLIALSDMSIHDLSRIKSSQKDEYSRMNIPFELGMDYGRKVTLNSTKPILVLEEEKYSFHRGLSDYSGFDILCHRGDSATAVKVLRDWFVGQRMVKDLASPTVLWYEYTDCWTFINQKLTDRGFTDKEASDIPYNEFHDLVVEWLSGRPRGED